MRNMLLHTPIGKDKRGMTVVCMESGEKFDLARADETWESDHPHGEVFRFEDRYFHVYLGFRRDDHPPIGSRTDRRITCFVAYEIEADDAENFKI